jgi:hypothetical protein
MTTKITKKQKIFIKKWLVNGSDPIGCPFAFKECNKLCLRMFPGLKEARQNLSATRICPCRIFSVYYMHTMALQVVDWTYTDLKRRAKKLAEIDYLEI